MVQAPESFSTERLMFRRPRLTDAEAIFEYASDPQVVRYMDYPPRNSIHEVEQAVQEKPRQWAANSFSWVIIIKPQDRPIGTISCWVDGHAAGFGYVLNRNDWGQGYGTEAARALVEWAISLPKIYRVWATCDAENLASARVLKKCSLVCEGKLRCYLVRPNISPLPRDALMYARVRAPKW
jgi:ribosomal-protein-alanine N-acetyltransferase